MFWSKDTVDHSKCPGVSSENSYAFLDHLEWSRTQFSALDTKILHTRHFGLTTRSDLSKRSFCYYACIAQPIYLGYASIIKLLGCQTTSQATSSGQHFGVDATKWSLAHPEISPSNFTHYLFCNLQKFDIKID